ncbi:MAG: sensor histidine kinase, partial [Candidatus Rokuibacteriota bacterium]
EADRAWQRSEERGLTDELSALRERHNRAVAYISHVLRGSLTNILGFSKLLLRRVDGPLNETQTAGVLTIQQAGGRLLTFVNALAELARLEAGTADRRPADIDVSALLREIASERELPGAVNVKLEEPAEALTVHADRGHVRLIVSTLVDQAVSRTGHGDVVLAARRGGDVIDVEVAHPGRRIAVEELPNLFEPFPVRDASPSFASDGGRVQLAVARSLAILNGGTLGADSGHDDLGVRFTLRLPAMSGSAPRGFAGQVIQQISSS